MMEATEKKLAEATQAIGTSQPLTIDDLCMYAYTCVHTYGCISSLVSMFWYFSGSHPEALAKPRFASNASAPSQSVP